MQDELEESGAVAYFDGLEMLLGHHQDPEELATNLQAVLVFCKDPSNAGQYFNGMTDATYGEALLEPLAQNAILTGVCVGETSEQIINRWENDPGAFSEQTERVLTAVLADVEVGFHPLSQGAESLVSAFHAAFSDGWTVIPFEFFGNESIVSEQMRRLIIKGACEGGGSILLRKCLEQLPPEERPAYQQLANEYANMSSALGEVFSQQGIKPDGIDSVLDEVDEMDVPAKYERFMQTLEDPNSSVIKLKGCAASIPVLEICEAIPEASNTNQVEMLLEMIVERGGPVNLYPAALSVAEGGDTEKLQAVLHFAQEKKLPVVGELPARADDDTDDMTYCKEALVAHIASQPIFPTRYPRISLSPTEQNRASEFILNVDWQENDFGDCVLPLGTPEQPDTNLAWALHAKLEELVKDDPSMNGDFALTADQLIVHSSRALVALQDFVGQSQAPGRG